LILYSTEFFDSIVDYPNLFWAVMANYCGEILCDQ